LKEPLGFEILFRTDRDSERLTVNHMSGQYAVCQNDRCFH
jgi:hypothetical protein